jgi:putative Holliday junction resolvase
MNAARPWRLLLEDYEPDVLVCGRPLTLAGDEGAQARKLEEQVDKIARAAGLPVVFVDERLSSAQAKRILREQGMNEKQMRGKVDAVAASIFLQAYLDGLRDTEGE